jgi:hypothetical protein
MLGTLFPAWLNHSKLGFSPSAIPDVTLHIIRAFVPPMSSLGFDPSISTL